MKTEYEVRILEINEKVLIQKLEELGATKIGEYNQKRYVYDLKPASPQKWIRLRTNGKTTTLTYKNIETNKIDGTKELEIEVSDFEATNTMLEILGYQNKGYQENKRIQYRLNGVEIDIDTWPLIPTYVEIEGKDEQSVLKMIKILGLNNEKVTTLDVQSVYMQYGIDIEKKKDLRF